MRSIIWIAALILPLCGGCATVLRGTHQTIGVNTDPTGANVNVNGTPYTSPARVDIPRKQPVDVVVSKEGFQSIQFTMNPEYDGLSLIGNMILPGGSVGLITDNYDGADKAFFELATIKLVPASQPSQAPLKLTDFKGHLLTDEQYAAAIKADRDDRSQFFRGQP